MFYGFELVVRSVVSRLNNTSEHHEFVFSHPPDDTETIIYITIYRVSTDGSIHTLPHTTTSQRVTTPGEFITPHEGKISVPIVAGSVAGTVIFCALNCIILFLIW